MELVWDGRALTPQGVTNTTSSSKHYRKRGLQISLDNCDDVLCFLQEFRVLHHSVPAATRKQVVERFSHFTPVDPAEIELPDEPAQPIEALRKPLDGLQCTTCGFITINKDTVRMHCKKHHQQAWTGDKSLLYNTVKVQSFFRTGGLQKYFVVQVAEAQNAEDVDVKVAVQRQLAEYRLTQQEVEEELQTLEETAKTDKTGWFKQTGWLEFFKDRNLVHLARQVRAPDPNERKVRLAAKLTERLIERSVKGLATLPQELRRWLRSAKQSEVDPRPIGRLENPESQAVYASYVAKFVCFYLRVLADEEQRIMQFREQQGSAVDCESEEASSSEADSGDNEEGSEADDSDSMRPRRRTRRKPQPDPMKDARELFTWTDDQKSHAIKLWDALDGDNRAT
ncbi:recq family helicase [Stemphylium lycopersici]|uniref:Recq family helicase n=1 Tax=Stemphylium lycopersici TaxID=183478 RepID=A0A364MRA7_STELY|nr:recq family helicase [Stemphylium lycopersici]